MSFEFVTKLPTPTEIKEQYPVPEEIKTLKAERDAEIADVITGKSDKLLVIIGPCSADNETAVLDYTSRLVKVQEKIKDKVIIIPRVYTNKPRTTGVGYKGMLHQPDPEKKPDLLAGLVAIRKMHIDVMKVPAGMKNPTSGDFSVMLNSVVAAQSKQTFIYRNWEVNTPGNPLTHTILRGAVNKHGQTIPNYHYEDLIRLYNMYAARDLENPAVIVDANHSNSGKQYLEQIRIVKEVLNSCHYGKSITDACLGWAESEKLLYDIADLI